MPKVHRLEGEELLAYVARLEHTIRDLKDENAELRREMTEYRRMFLEEQADAEEMVRAVEALEDTVDRLRFENGRTVKEVFEL